MEAEDHKPIAREPWQRLLRERYDAPPEVTDARIRAAARRALAPRPSRWWLPASLAASVLFAVMLVQWQYGKDRTPAYVTESDVAAPTAGSPPTADAEAAGAAAADESAADATPSAGRAREVREAPATRPDVAVPFVPPPLIEPPAAGAPRKPVREREARATAITASEPARAAESAVSAYAETASGLGKAGALANSAAAPRDPEEWYQAIEALRAEGQIEEAAAEQARLEEAWPGWLEKNRPQNR